MRIIINHSISRLAQVAGQAGFLLSMALCSILGLPRQVTAAEPLPPITISDISHTKGEAGQHIITVTTDSDPGFSLSLALLDSQLTLLWKTDRKLSIAAKLDQIEDLEPTVVSLTAGSVLSLTLGGAKLMQLDVSPWNPASRTITATLSDMPFVPEWEPYELHYASPGFVKRMLDTALGVKEGGKQYVQIYQPPPPPQGQGGANPQGGGTSPLPADSNFKQDTNTEVSIGTTKLGSLITDPTFLKTDELNTADTDLIWLYTQDPPRLEFMKGKLAEFDRQPRHVQLELWVCEIKESTFKDLGVETGTVGAGGQIISGVGANFLEGSVAGASKFEAFSLGDFARSSGLDFSVFLNTLINQNKVQLLANEKLSTVDGQSVAFVAVERVPFASSQAISNGVSTVGISYADVGLVLSFLPRSVPNDGIGPLQGLSKADYLTQDRSQADYLTLRVVPRVSSIAEYRPVFNGITAPVIEQREMNGIVRVQNGQTFCLANVIREEDRTITTKVPLLSKMPLLGKLFRSTRRDKERSKICIFVRPTISTEMSTSELPCACVADAMSNCLNCGGNK
jgi:hypothetical protein